MIFKDYTEGFEDDGTQSQPILPAVTELNNAMLCDDMPVLGAVQLGPTGRSVSRSYAAALDKLIAKGILLLLKYRHESLNQGGVSNRCNCWRRSE